MDVSSFLAHSRREIKRGYILAALTDSYVMAEWPLVDDNWSDERKTLEIRIFDETMENKLVRGDISGPFRYRTIKDGSEKRDSFDEWQYLDIDESIEVDNNGQVHTTGGGRFYLPQGKTKNARVQIRYYLGRYEETGQARVEDWRVVGLRHD